MKELSEGRNDVMITDSESQGGKSPHSSSDSIIINMPFSQWSKLVEQKGATPRKRLIQMQIQMHQQKLPSRVHSASERCSN